MILRDTHKILKDNFTVALLTKNDEAFVALDATYLNIKIVTGVNAPPLNLKVMSYTFNLC